MLSLASILHVFKAKAFSFTKPSRTSMIRNTKCIGQQSARRLAVGSNSLSNQFRIYKQMNCNYLMVMISPEGVENASSTDLSSSPPSSSEYGTNGGEAKSEMKNEPSRIAPNLDLLPDAEKRKRRKYERKRPRRVSEEELYKMRKKRQEEYEGLRKQRGKVNLWDFESLFPEPVWDDETIRRDLYEVSDRDSKAGKDMLVAGFKRVNVTSSVILGPKVDIPLKRELSKLLPPKLVSDSIKNSVSKESFVKDNVKSSVAMVSSSSSNNNNIENKSNVTEARVNSNSTKVDRSLTRMVEDRLYGFRRDQMGDFEYDTSLMGDGAVKFRDGVRLGNALKVNCDRLNYFAKKELAKGKLEEAEELYEMAIEMSPRDGRAYLGLSRIAQRRRDFKFAKECLKRGIANSSRSDKTWGANGMKVSDTGANPFLLQALGTLEERLGHLSEAERLYIAAARSRPSHAAAWVALAQLRCRKLRQGPDAGRVCYRTAEVELMRAGLKPSSHVYTAWASLEWKAGQIKRARELFRQALDIDPKCSAAWNQLGVMEAQVENWDEAEQCFQTVLKFDGRNSRVLQAYAIMETKRPESDSRKALGLFERALKANPRDGGVYQAYALFVAKLGDIDAARGLFKRGTEVDKKHAPLWQAWGVLETRHGSAITARDIFQQGIWSCAQSSGGQSGGRRCARLWQAWGVLEAKEGDYAAARRCFSRALDADNRNVATVTAWTTMEEKLGKIIDARLIFERALKQFGPQSDEKTALWRAYELMESRAGSIKAAQNVFQRSIRDALVYKENYPEYGGPDINKISFESSNDAVLKQSRKNEVEVSEWKSRKNLGFGENAEVWLNDGSIEGKVPPFAMKKKINKAKE